MTTPNRAQRRAGISQAVKQADNQEQVKASAMELAETFRLAQQRADICLNPASTEEDYKQFSNVLAQLAQAMNKLKAARKGVSSGSTQAKAKRKR